MAYPIKLSRAKALSNDYSNCKACEQTKIISQEELLLYEQTTLPSILNQLSVPSRI